MAVHVSIEGGRAVARIVGDAERGAAGSLSHSLPVPAELPPRDLPGLAAFGAALSAATGSAE